MRKLSLLVNCPEGMCQNRGVILTESSMTVGYAPAGGIPTHITICNAEKRIGTDKYTIEVIRIDTLDGTADLRADTTAVIPIGSQLQISGAEGKFAVKTTGKATGLVAYEASTANSSFTGFYSSPILSQVTTVLSGSKTYNPGSLATLTQETTDVTVTGASLGDFVCVSFSLNPTGLTVTGVISASNTVTAIFSNVSAGTIDLAEGTLSVKVIKG